MQAEVEQPRLDLSDPEAAFFCATCGARYARSVAACATCAASLLLARDEILAHISASAPGLGTVSPVILVPAGDVGMEERAALRSELESRGLPFLLLGQDRRPLDPARWSDAEAIWVPESLARRHAFQDPVLLVDLAQVGDEAEAARIRSRLEEAGIPFFLNQRYSPYEIGVGDLGQVRWYVDRRDLERARAAIRAPAPEGRDEEDVDGRQWRAGRRYRIARWFLFAQAVGGGLVALNLTRPFLAVWGLLVAAASLGIAVWSRRQPRRAFGAALGLNAVLALVTAATRGVVGLVGLIPLLAVYFAWNAAGPAGLPEAGDPRRP
jgi:hypothetical protein